MPKLSQIESWFNAGLVEMQSQQFEFAETFFRKIIDANPEVAEAWVNLGITLEALNRVSEAETCFNEAIKLRPDHDAAYANLANLLCTQKRHKESERAFLQALILNPDSASTHSNFGVLLACMKRETEAESSYRLAIEIDHTCAKAYFNLSYLLLRQGRFAEGWACLEYRFAIGGAFSTTATDLPFPRWQGESLSGKKILVLYEQGHGDEIQFFRYLPILKAMGTKHITLVCKPALKALFKAQNFADDLYASNETLANDAYDFWVFPLSIPLYCKTDLDSIPANIPYIRPSKQHLTKWEPHLQTKNLKVGLVWKGSTSFENDTDRSLPDFTTLAPLWSIPNITFLSLQKGAGENEAKPYENTHPMISLGQQIQDFADAAAIVDQLDLIICVDTAIAHLAGAMGKPCWVMLPDYKTDWRWLKGREDSPWYPNHMRLFRQKTAGDWSEVIHRIKEALAVKTTTYLQ